MALVTLKEVSVSFGADALLDHANLTIEANERIGLIGRNGAGKSTLLKLIDDEIAADDGEVVRQQGVVTGRLIQEVPNDIEYDIRSVVALGDAERGQALADYYLKDSSTKETKEAAAQDLQQQLNDLDAWSLDRQVRTLCSKFDLDPRAGFAQLSGGMKRPRTHGACFGKRA